MNQIIIVGRLTADPAMSYSNGKDPVAHAMFNFAVPDITMKKNDSGNYPTDFFRCTAWNRLAEVIAKHCAKGTKLMVIGRLKNNSYEKDGQKIYSNEILIDSLEFLETKKPE
jgi:single stranded DNA-binding protein (ssb)